MTNTNSRFFGGTLIVAGTSIGAAMIAMPITSAQLGFANSTVMMLVVWALMCFSALLGLEINLRFGKAISIAQASQEVLGRFGKWISAASLFVLLYALLSAYIAGGSAIVREMISGDDLPSGTVQVLFTVLMGIAVYASTHAVDLLNRGLFTVKLILFAIISVLIGSHVDLGHLQTGLEYTPAWWAALPVVFTAFGFHGSIPAIVNYIGADHPRRCRSAFVLGSLLPLLLYILWQGISLGALPLTGTPSFEPVLKAKGDIGVFIQQLNAVVGNTQLNWISRSFVFTTITTSFLGVAIGLFDLLAESTQASNSHTGRLKTTLLTLVLPLGVAIAYPQAFIIALGFSSIALSILGLVMPVIVLWLMRSRGIGEEAGYTVGGGKLALVVTFLFGTVVIVTELVELLCS